MKHKCLYCYGAVEEGKDFHEKCSLKFFGTTIAPIMPYTLDQMDELALQVVERSVSVPGVQPKLSLSFLKGVGDSAENRLTVVGALGGNYIFKPPSSTYPELPANEHLTMRMAEIFGIRVVPSSLIKLSSGELSYITKRIDREENGGKIHMLDMFQITEAFDKYRSSMERVGKAVAQYSDQSGIDLLFLFEITVFSFLTGNNDMHLKNFSMIQSSAGWVLAPSYDLLNAKIVNPEDQEELALTMGGRKRKFTQLDFRDFGADLGLTDRQIARVFTRFEKQKGKVMEWIKRSFLSMDMQKAYSDLLDERYDRLK
ncbi:HipA domain-containing protein [Algoriphagus sp. D3-2-R+10]|uniref:HipA domain-containing protein n=1 Tax=Algoriphagus aurantiacus TaxID=3103948 RepID=UPI002B3EE44F|nr:HipA domain-containing protein [Algoriphagus sp. D3-2-R+10]MEB2774282.1 HipA domain-containing protein [Algoriphagus sp. D3-2-R+10]